MNNKNTKEILFYFILISLMILSFNLALRDYTGIIMSPVQVLLISLAASASASIILIFPKVVSAGLIPVSGLLFFYCYRKPESVKLYIQKSLEFISWFWRYLAGYDYFEKAYSLQFIIVIILLAALVISTIAYKEKGVLPLILTGTAVMAYFWFVYVSKARLYLAFFLFASIMLYSYQTYKKRHKEWIAADCIIDYKTGLNWMICSGAVITASLLLSTALPLSLGPVKWSWLNEKVINLFPFIAEWRNDASESSGYGFNSRYSFSSMGHIGNKLGGEIRMDDSVVMLVRTGSKETLYLRGAIMDKYYENGWSKSGKRYKEYKPDNPMSIPYGNNVGFYERNLEISHRKLLTSTIFAPYSLYRVQHDGRRIYMDADSEVYAPKITAIDTVYKVTSIIPYIDIREIKLTGAETLREEDFKRYTSLPDNIPERVRELSYGITNAERGNYDKAKAIENYLRRNYTYSLKPPRLPLNKEFTDHFLFEGEEGYCTYFATSMAILLRASGVPCRYVEGFITTYEGAYEREIKGTDAHAWVEVFFDGYGWITYEPTPQYPAVEILNPGLEKDEISKDVTNDTITGEKEIDGIPGYFGQPENEEMVGSGIINDDGKRPISFVSIILLITMSFLTARFIFLLMKQIITEIGLERSNGVKFASDYIKNVNRYLRRAGFEMKAEETLREFINRLEFDCGQGFDNISKVTTILERIRYGGYEPSDEDRNLLRAFVKAVKSFATKKAGFFNYLISMYLIGDRKNGVHKISC